MGNRVKMHEHQGPGTHCALCAESERKIKAFAQRILKMGEEDGLTPLEGLAAINNTMLAFFTGPDALIPESNPLAIGKLAQLTEWKVLFLSLVVHQNHNSPPPPFERE